MLPDYLEIKKQITIAISRRMQSQLKINFLNEKGMRTVHEGNSLKVIREDGTVDKNNFDSFETTIEFPVQEIENIDIGQINEKIEKATFELKRQKENHIFSKIDEITKQTGNVYDARGNLTPEKFIDFLEQMPIAFDKKGKVATSIVCAPNMTEKFASIFNAIEAKDELKKRMDDIMIKKKKEWDDREHSRKLVD